MVHVLPRCALQRAKIHIEPLDLKLVLDAHESSPLGNKDLSTTGMTIIYSTVYDGSCDSFALKYLGETSGSQRYALSLQIMHGFYLPCHSIDYPAPSFHCIKRYSSPNPENLMRQNSLN